MTPEPQAATTCDSCGKSTSDAPVDWRCVTSPSQHLHACSPECAWKLELQLGTALASPD